MSIDSNELKISELQLEELLNFNIISVLAIALSRIFFLKKKIYSKSLLYLPNNTYQLLANLESGLVNLSSFSLDNCDRDRQLLSQVIEIGLSVHQEIRKTKTLR